MISDGVTNVVIDVGPDFRMQMLTHQVQKIDAVVLTHEHNDHIIGLDDLRPYIFRNKKHMKIYAEGRVLKDIQHRFDYAFRPHKYPGIPRFELEEIEPGQVISINGIDMKALRVFHGELPILGFKVNKLAYLTDTNRIPPETLSELKDLDYLLLDALREKYHHSHFSLSGAIDVARQLGVKKTYFIHMSHLLGPTKIWEKNLPQEMFASFDGLVLDV